MKVKVKSLSRHRFFATPWTVTYQAPPSMGFFRQEYWSGLPFPSPEDLPNPGMEPRSQILKEAAKTAKRGYIWKVGMEGEGNQRALFFTIDLKTSFDLLKIMDVYHFNENKNKFDRLRNLHYFNFQMSCFLLIF